MNKESACKKALKGKVEGEITLSSDAVCFYTVEPEIGKVTEGNHHLKNRNIAGKILVMLSGKGSPTIQADGFYKPQLYGKTSKVIVVQHTDIVLVSSVIITRIPMVHKVERGFYQEIKDGTKICVNADNGKIIIL